MQRLPTARRHSKGPPEMAGHMALIGKAGRLRCFGKRIARAYHGFRTIEAAHRQITIGARSEPRPEMARKRVAAEARDGLELLRGDGAREMRVEELPRLLNRTVTGRPGGRGPSCRVIERQQGLRDAEHGLILLDGLQAVVEIIERRKQGFEQV